MAHELDTEKPTRTGEIVGKPAFDFSLKDKNGHSFHFFEALKKGPALLVFYPKDFTSVCTKQLCGYRDNIDAFEKYGVQVIGISANASESHSAFAERHDFAFTLLSDPAHIVAKTYGCRSPFLLGAVSRAVVIVNRARFIVYRYIEPTPLSHRKASELLGVLADLTTHGILP